MSSSLRTEELVESALNQSANRVFRKDRGAWSFELMNGRCVEGVAKLDKNWLRMKVRGEHGADLTPDALWDHAVLNGRLAGGTKFTLDTNRNVRMRSDVAVNKQPEFFDRVDEACQGLLHGVTNEPVPAAGTGTLATAPDFCALGADAGWDVEGRPDDHWVAQLDNTDAFYQAHIAHTDLGMTQLNVELGATNQVEPASRTALGHFLLTVSHEVRLGRAVAVQEGEGIRASFEVCFESSPTHVDLAHALSALSVATRVAGNETTALFDAAVAERYLAVQGWAL